MKKWWIGCSGFYYKGWKLKFYPDKLPQRKWFEFYCQFYNTVELNVTFYRFPKLEALEGWYNRSPTDFRFTVKAPRLITHYRRFREAHADARAFYDIVQKGLKEKLGPVLFQLHPGIRYSEETFERILDTLDPSFTNVLEFRHESWWNDDVYRVLRQNNISFCGISYPELPETIMKTAPVVYYRFHGVPDLYLSSYTDDELEMVAGEIGRLPGVKEVFAYFNNDIQVAAVYNAKSLQVITGSK